MTNAGAPALLHAAERDLAFASFTAPCILVTQAAVAAFRFLGANGMRRASEGSEARHDDLRLHRPGGLRPVARAVARVWMRLGL
jgi:hypothetical protein